MGKGSRIQSIEGIRGLAILLVVLFHYSTADTFIPFISNWGGGLGNQIFFFIGGFCLFRSFYVSKIIENTNRYSCFQFLFDRFKKIYPAYFLSVFFTLLFIGPRNMTELLINLLMLHKGWFISDLPVINVWFLSAFLFCNIIFYFLVRKYGNDNNILFFFTLILIISKIILDSELEYPIINSVMSYSAFPFFAGCICSEIEKKVNKKTAIILFIFDLVCIVICIAGSLILDYKKIMGDTDVIFNIIIIPLTLISILNIPALDKLLSIQPLKWLGGISFLLFIWNGPFWVFGMKILELLGLSYGYREMVIMILLLTVWCIIYRKAEGWILSKLTHFVYDSHG